MQDRWYNYVCEEFVPRLLEINREQGEDVLDVELSDDLALLDHQ